MRAIVVVAGVAALKGCATGVTMIVRGIVVVAAVAALNGCTAGVTIPSLPVAQAVTPAARVAPSSAAQAFPPALRFGAARRSAERGRGRPAARAAGSPQTPAAPQPPPPSDTRPAFDDFLADVRQEALSRGIRQ